MGHLAGPRELLHAGRVSDRHHPTEWLLWIKAAFKLSPAGFTGSLPNEASLHGDTKTAGPHVGVAASGVLARKLQLCHLQPNCQTQDRPRFWRLTWHCPQRPECCLAAWCWTHVHTRMLTHRGCPDSCLGGCRLCPLFKDKSGVDRRCS